MSKVLRLTGLSKTFGTSTVLSGVDLALATGERLAVVGSSGSGKTTLLRLIAGLEIPTAGEIAISGTVVSRAGAMSVPPERRNVAMVFQGLALFPHLRALDQVAFAVRGPDGRERAKQLLARVGLAHRASARLYQLSGGERQRVALARALAQQPTLFLMDEPFASLDDELRSEMRALLAELLDGSPTTLVLVSHGRDDALTLAQRVIVLDRGRPVATDAISNVLADPQHAAAVRAFSLGDVIDGETSGGRVARTPFGDATLTRSAPIGRVRLLVRPGQARLVSSDAGVEATVMAIELRPPTERHGEVEHIAVVSTAGQRLRVAVKGSAPPLGATVRMVIEGWCVPVQG